jgi:ABC-type dipeptide/oligopeptide/nickel transport system permease component
MREYAASRIGRTAIILFLITLIVFSLVYFIGNDVIYLPYPGPNNPDYFQWLKRQTGNDGQFFLVSYFQWLGEILRGDFGPPMIISD